MVGASVTRAVLVGGAVWLIMAFWPGVHVGVAHPISVVWFGLMGSLMLAFLGLLTSIWAEKFDHAAAVTNFVVAPLSLLSGTFYAVDQLSLAFSAISHPIPSSTSIPASGTASSAQPIRRSGLAASALRC